MSPVDPSGAERIASPENLEPMDPHHAASKIHEASPRLLPLVDQMDFTDGLCSAFAVAVSHRFPDSRLAVLYSEDPRHLITHDHPLDEPMLVHVCVVLPNGDTVDAEGQRSPAELARAFGVKRGFKHRWVTLDEEALKIEMPFSPERVLDAQRTLALHGWGPTAPQANGELTRRWKTTRAAQTVRGPRALPSLDSGDVAMPTDRAQAARERQTLNEVFTVPTIKPLGRPLGT